MPVGPHGQAPGSVRRPRQSLHCGSPRKVSAGEQAQAGLNKFGGSGWQGLSPVIWYLAPGD